MELPETRPLVMLWWNTSLSPLGKSRASSVDKGYVAAYLAELRRTLDVDIMALGEVCVEDVNDIIAAIDDPHLSFHDATRTVDGRTFDIAVLFDRRRLSLDASGPILDSFGKTTLKVAERLSFISCETGRHLHLFVSHWPSRLHCAELAPKRTEIGIALRKTLDDIRNCAPFRQFIVLMGDYNDDPYAPSLADHLLATRDRELARTNDAFLYNPFWRRLGESEPFAHGQRTSSIGGTYYYSRGQRSRWFTFDQIMFSSAFLNDGPFHLNEGRSMVVRSEELELRIRNNREKFDHFPILGVLDIQEAV